MGSAVAFFNSLIRLIASLPPGARDLSLDLVKIVIVVMPAMLLGTHGHHWAWGLLPLWPANLLLVVVVLAFFIVQGTFASRTRLVLTGMVLLLIAVMGASDRAVEMGITQTGEKIVQYDPGLLRLAATISATLLVEGAAVFFGALAWGAAIGALGGIATISTGLALKEAPDPAWKVFTTFSIIAFWLGIGNASLGLAAPRIPVIVALGILQLVVLTIPGILVIGGDVPFRVVLYLTIAALLTLVGYGIWLVLQSVGVVPPLGEILAPAHGRTFSRGQYWAAVAILILGMAIATFILHGTDGLRKYGVRRAAVVLVAASFGWWWLNLAPGGANPLYAPLSDLIAWQPLLRSALLLVWALSVADSYSKKGLAGLPGPFVGGLMLLLAWSFMEWLIWEGGGIATTKIEIGKVWSR